MSEIELKELVLKAKNKEKPKLHETILVVQDNSNWSFTKSKEFVKRFW